MRPCAMIFREQPDEPWGLFDFALVEAYTIMNDEKCQLCGNPVWLCQSTSRDVQFQVKTYTCRATKALETFKDKNKPKGQKAKPEEKKFWGQYYSSVPKPVFPDVPLPSRKDFFEDGKIEGKEG